MAKRVQLRRGTTAQTNTFTGAVGEVTVDTTKKTLVLHDGVTAGGKPLPTLENGKVPLDQLTDSTTSTKGIVQLATQSEVNTGTDAERAVTPATLSGTFLQQTKNALNASGSAPVYACRAWVNFNGTGTVAIRASGNVSSITDNGVGNYTINFTTALPDSNYAVSYSAGQLGGGQHAGRLLSLSTSSVNVYQEQDSSSSYPASDSAIVTVAVFR